MTAVPAARVGVDRFCGVLSIGWDRRPALVLGAAPTTFLPPEFFVVIVIPLRRWNPALDAVTRYVALARETDRPLSRKREATKCTDKR
jgi:hypothetical protein